MIKIYQKKIGDSIVKEIEEVRTGCWIYAQNINEEETSFLEEKFNLNPNTLKDAMDPYEVPRVEIDEKIIYIFTRVPQKLEEKIITTPLLIVVGSNFVMTLSKTESPILNKFIKDRLNFTTTQKTQLVLRFLSEIMKTYNDFLSDISKDVREINAKFNKINEKIIMKFVSFEEILNDFLLALTHTNPALKKIISGKFIQLYREDQELMEDLVLSTNQLVDLCNSTLKNIVNIREAYSTIISNNLNKVIKLFTSLTVILTIPTIIASLYGMNVGLPFANNPNAFWIVIGGTVVVVSVVFYVFSRNRWL